MKTPMLIFSSRIESMCLVHIAKKKIKKYLIIKYVLAFFVEPFCYRVTVNFTEKVNEFINFDDMLRL